MRAAEVEGAKVEFLVAPTRIEEADGALRLFLSRMELGEPDASGRPAPRSIPGSEYVVSVDTVMAAIGQVPGISDTWRLAREPDGTITVEKDTLKTSRTGVFAGGDVVLGPMNIIQAIAQGRKAAEEIDRFLGGSGAIEEALAPDPGEEMEYHPGIHAYGKSCVSMSELPPATRTRHFEVVEQGYTEEQAKEESLRCVRCDLWSVKGTPELWWKHRGLRPYWLGGDDRMGREKDRKRAREYGPYQIKYDHAPYIPHEYTSHEENNQ
jgi:hypothetical protein